MKTKNVFKAAVVVVALSATTVQAQINLNKNPLYLNTASDPYHGLRYAGGSPGVVFSGVAVDGPALYGYAGGVLGSYHGAGAEKIALFWNADAAVGINTTSLSTFDYAGSIKLQVNGNAFITGGNSALFYGDDNNPQWSTEYLVNGAIAGLNFWKPLGSTNPGDYKFFLRDDGNVGIGTNLNTNPNNYKLAVNGTIGAKAVKIEISSVTWADYVFASDYKLKSLTEVETFFKANKHLPNIPSAKEVEEKGLDVADMQAKQMEKIEELTLYIIEQNKKIEEQHEAIIAQNKRIAAIETTKK